MKRRITLLAVLALFLLPLAAQATGLPNPLQANTIEDLLINVVKAIIGVVAVVATFMFIYGGVMMLTSAGNADQVRRSKEVLKWTTISLIIIFFTGAIVGFVFTALGSNTNIATVTNKAGLGNANLQTSAVNVIRAVLGLLGIVGTAMIILGGYWWMTAAGNQDRVKTAKRVLSGAVIGLVIIFLAWAIVSFTLRTAANTSGEKAPSTFQDHLSTPHLAAAVSDMHVR